MSYKFYNGENVRFNSEVDARKSILALSDIIHVNSGSHGVVVSYNQKNSIDDISDDIVGIKITSGDEAIGQTVYVFSNEFNKISKI